MTIMRSRWAVLPGLGALAAAAVLLSGWQGATSARGEWGYHGASSPQGRQPVQPINFPHPVHVKTLGMNCIYCHFSANKSMDPGLPAVSTCMGCHTVIGPDRPKSETGPARKSPEIAKLQKYWMDKRPVPWVRIHRVPDYVQFPHMRHVDAGVACQSCHGDVQNMQRVYQYASLNMGWCVNCHVSGYTPPARAPQGLAVPPGQQTTAAQPAPVRTASISGPLVGMYGYPRKARYDCSTCHY